MDMFRKWRERRHNDPAYKERKQRKEEKRQQEMIQQELWMNSQPVRSSSSPTSTTRPTAVTSPRSSTSSTGSSISSSRPHSESFRSRLQRSRELLAEQMEANAWLASSRTSYGAPNREVEDMMRQVRQMERMIFRQIEQIRELSRMPSIGTIEIVISDLPDDIGDMLPQLRSMEGLDYERLLELFPPQNRGATRDQIQQVPSRTYTKTQQNNSTQSESNSSCPICFSEFEEGEAVKSLPKCHHGFHTACIDKWLGINKVCPVCRTELN